VSGRVETVPPPPPVETRLFRWLTDVRAALGLEAARTPALLNGWGDAGAPYPACGYFRRQGLVYLQGRITGGGFPALAFVLPPGFRPEWDLAFPVITGGGPGRLDVLGDGSVWTSAAGAPAGWVSVNGVYFRAGG
jgi:hypothetical protein